MIISLSVWTTRNYISTQKITVLETSSSYMADESHYELLQQQFYTSWGGDAIYWIDNNDGSWFSHPVFMEEAGNKRAGDEIFPEYLFNDKLTIDTLKRARALYWSAFDVKHDNIINPANLKESGRILSDFKLAVQEDHPFHYYFTSKITLLYKFLNQKQGLNTRSIAYPINVGFAFTEAFNARVIFFVGLLATIFISIFGFKDSILIKMILANVGFVALFFPFYYGWIEFRYVSTAVPFLLLALILAFYSIHKKNKKTFYFLLSFITVVLITAGISAIQTEIVW
jgi:hypothetical protein